MSIPTQVRGPIKKWKEGVSVYPFSKLGEGLLSHRRKRRFECGGGKLEWGERDHLGLST